MSPLIPCLWVSGLIHLAGVLVNLGAPRVLGYSENLARLSPAVRLVFVSQALWGSLLLAAMGILCLLFPQELLTSTFLARYLSWFLAVLWGARALVQLLFYDPEVRRRHPFTYVLFLSAFLYQTVLFALVALGGGRGAGL